MSCLNPGSISYVIERNLENAVIFNINKVKMLINNYIFIYLFLIKIHSIKKGVENNFNFNWGWILL